jgi:hypothetical protein
MRLLQIVFELKNLHQIYENKSATDVTVNGNYMKILLVTKELTGDAYLATTEKILFLEKSSPYLVVHLFTRK